MWAASPGARRAALFNRRPITYKGLVREGPDWHSADGMSVSTHKALRAASAGTRVARICGLAAASDLRRRATPAPNDREADAGERKISTQSGPKPAAPKPAVRAASERAASET